MVSHLKLCVAVARHNFKLLKIQIEQVKALGDKAVAEKPSTHLVHKQGYTTAVVPHLSAGFQVHHGVAGGEEAGLRASLVVLYDLQKLFLQGLCDHYRPF